MSKFTSQNNEKVINIRRSYGDIKLSSNHLYGLLAFFALLFAIIYAIPKSPEPSNANTAVNTSIIQTNIANSPVNSPVNNQTAETNKKTSTNTTNKYPKKPDTAPTVSRRKIPKKETSGNSDFTPSDCSGTSNGCQ